MSLRADSGTECARRTANLPDTTTLSACCWIKLDAGSGAERLILDVRNTTISDVVWFDIEQSPGTLNCGICAEDNGSGGTNGGCTTNTAFEYLPTGAWLFVTMVTSTVPADTKLRVYDASGTLYTTATFAGGATMVNINATQMTAFGHNTLTTLTLRGLGAHMRVWDARLTDVEFLAERLSATPVRTTNFNTGFSGYSTTLTDTGPNGRDWTNNGLTYDSDEPFPAVSVTYYRTRFVT